MKCIRTDLHDAAFATLNKPADTRRPMHGRDATASSCPGASSNG